MLGKATCHQFAYRCCEHLHATLETVQHLFVQHQPRVKGSIQKHRRHAIPLRQRGCLWPRTLLQHRPVHRECVPCRPSTWSPARRATLVRNSTQHVWASPPCSHRLHHPPQAQPELPASMSHQWSTRQVVSAVDDSSHMGNSDLRLGSTVITNIQALVALAECF